MSEPEKASGRLARQVERASDEVRARSSYPKPPVEDDGLALSDADWQFYVHEDGEFAGVFDINRHSGETLLRIGGQPGPPGHRDLARVREFAEHYRSLAALPSRDQLGELEAWLEAWLESRLSRVSATRSAFAGHADLRLAERCEAEEGAFRAVLQRIREGK